MKHRINSSRFRAFALVIMMVIVIAGLSWVGCRKSADQTAAPGQQKGVVYTCPMHPNVVQDKPGKCPICGMDLVPKQSGTAVDTKSKDAGKKDVKAK